MSKPKFTVKELLSELEDCKFAMQFMHMCLTSPKTNVYQYPEQTVEHLDRLNLIVSQRDMCFHSMTKEGCAGCLAGNKARKLHYSVNSKIGFTHKAYHG